MISGDRKRQLSLSHCPGEAEATAADNEDAEDEADNQEDRDRCKLVPL